MMRMISRHYGFLLALVLLATPALTEENVDIPELGIDLDELILDVPPPAVEEEAPAVEDAPAAPAEVPPPETPDKQPEVPQVEPDAPQSEPEIDPVVETSEPTPPVVEPSHPPASEPVESEAAEAGTSHLIRLISEKNEELEQARAEIETLKRELKQVKDALHARGETWQQPGKPVIADKPLPHRAVTLYNEAVAHHEAGENRQAELKYLTVLEYEPTDGPTLYNLGILYDTVLKRKRLADKYYSLFLLHHRNSPEATQVYGWRKALSD